MSVLGNAKSNQHRKTRTVEPDGTGRKFMHLTRGDLRRESGAEVSRGRSSEEARRKAGGAKGRRTQRITAKAEWQGMPWSHSRFRGAGREPNFQGTGRVGSYGLAANTHWNGEACLAAQYAKSETVQPPDAENRMSGGVGVLTGENPVKATRSTPSLRMRQITKPHEIHREYSRRFIIFPGTRAAHHDPSG